MQVLLAMSRWLAKRTKDKGTVHKAVQKLKHMLAALWFASKDHTNISFQSISNFSFWQSRQEIKRWRDKMVIDADLDEIYKKE